MIINLDYFRAGSTPTPTPPEPTELVLYDAGDKKAAVTGGWAAFAPAWGGSCAVIPDGASSSVIAANPQQRYAETAGSLDIKFRNPETADGFNNAAWATANKIDLTGWTRLHIRAEAADSAGKIAHYHVFGVTNDKTAPGDPGTTTPPGTYAAIGANRDTVLEIAVSGSRYVYFAGLAQSRAFSGSGERYVEIVVTKIWLTK